MENNTNIVVDWQAFKDWYEKNTYGVWSIPEGEKKLTLTGDSSNIIGKNISWSIKIETWNGSIIDSYIPVEFVGFTKPQSGLMHFDHFNFTDPNSNPMNVDLKTIDLNKLNDLYKKYTDDQNFAFSIWRGHGLNNPETLWINQKRMEAVFALQHISFFNQMLAKAK